MGNREAKANPQERVLRMDKKMRRHSRQSIRCRPNHGVSENRVASEAVSDGVVEVV